MRLPHSQALRIRLQDEILSLRHKTTAYLRRTTPTAPDPKFFMRSDQPTVLLLPGVWGSWEQLLPWARALSGAGWDVRFLPELDRQLGSFVDLSDALQQALRGEGLRDVIIVAHSKGGLVAKQALLQDENSLIKGVIACGTPFFGTPVAKRIPAISRMNDLAPDNSEIVALSREETANRRIIAIQSQWDQNVPLYPRLPGGITYTVGVVGHNALLDSPEVAQKIVEFAEHIYQKW